MPSPVSPNDFKNAIPSAAGQFCAKFLNVFQLPKLAWMLADYLLDESGGLSTEFKTDICALACSGSSGGTVNPNMPAPTGLSATDGTYSDKITVTWNVVTPPSGVGAATEYKLYRSASTNTDPLSATLIATVTAPTVTYDDPVDGDLILGTTYNYWVVATNGTDTSNYGGPDVGNAGAPTTTLPAISDLRCTKGFNLTADGTVGLVWSTPSGATKYDIYRNTVNDSATATKIYSDVAPETTTDHFVASNTSQCWDNDGEIVFYDVPPLAAIHYYYFVIAKKDAPPATSPFSNGDSGWITANDATFNLTALILTRGQSAVQGVDFGGTKVRIVLFGGGGGGAGGGISYGGGGGGGGGVVVEEFTVGAGVTIALTASPNTSNTGNAAQGAGGIAGSTMTLTIGGVTKMVATGGGLGVYNAAGGGTGGAGASGTGTTSPTIYNGKAGAAAVAAKGGKSGYRFGSRRFPAAHYSPTNYSLWDGNGTNPSNPGAGSIALPSTPSLATGGFGQAGYALISSGT